MRDMEVPPTPIPTMRDMEIPPSHSYNEGQGNFTNSHGQNGNGGTPGLIELDGQGGEPSLENGEMRITNLSDFPMENPNLLLRGRELQSRI